MNVLAKFNLPINPYNSLRLVGNSAPKSLAMALDPKVNLSFHKIMPNILIWNARNWHFHILRGNPLCVNLWIACKVSSHVAYRPSGLPIPQSSK